MPEQFLRLNDVVRLTGLERSTIYAHGRIGRFPKPITVNGTVTAWLNSEVQAWMDSQIRASRPEMNEPDPLTPYPPDVAARTKRISRRCLSLRPSR